MNSILGKCAAAMLVCACFVASSLAATADVEDVKSISRLYSAAFDRVPKTVGLNFWVDSYESGRSLVDIAKDFYRSPEFISRYGPLADQQYVEQLYRNVLGRPGAQGGIEFWIAHLANGVSRAKVLANFSDSPENVSKTDETFRDMRNENGYWIFGEDSLPKLRIYKPGDSIVFEGEFEATEWKQPCCPLTIGPEEIIIRWDFLESSVTFENESVLLHRMTLSSPSFGLEEVSESHFYQTSDGAWFELIDANGNYYFDTANQRYGVLTGPSPLVAGTSHYVQYSILSGDNTSEPLTEEREDFTIESPRMESIPLGSIEVFPVSESGRTEFLTNYDSRNPGDYDEFEGLTWVSPTKGVVRLVGTGSEYTSSGSLIFRLHIDVTATWSSF